MQQTRRIFVRTHLRIGLGLAAGGIFGFPPGVAWASPAKAPVNAKLQEAMERHLGTARLAESTAIRLDLPDIAEDGAIVPLTVESSLEGVESLFIFVEKNPNPLAASFEFGKACDAFAALRIKMNESCEVIAALKTSQGWFGARRKVRVMVGGCG